jgi:phospholipase/lecithinase/hemolysin
MSMAWETKMVVVVFVLSFVLNLGPWAHGAPQVPCYFIFGDSLADSGNNNNLTTMAKPNYQPYGIDFPTGPSGRFCNGRTPVDIIAELLGFDTYMPAFATANGEEILKGVNYASGAAGIRKETGQQQGDRISMDAQLQNHQITVSRIAQILGNDSAATHLSKCIYSVGMGSNDYINNYFAPAKFYPASCQYTPEQYAVVLSDQYSQQLRSLYGFGARKVALIGVGLVGCTPYEMAKFGTNGTACVDIVNNAVQLFNERLVSLVDDLNKNLTDAKFTYLDSFGSASGNGTSPGFKVVNAPCCQVGSSKFTCTPLSNPCPDRTEYAFWDNVHPTEAMNVIIGHNYYNAPSPSDAHPYDINHLAQF